MAEHPVKSRFFDFNSYSRDFVSRFLVPRNDKFENKFLKSQKIRVRRSLLGIILLIRGQRLEKSPLTNHQSPLTNLQSPVGVTHANYQVLPRP